IGHGGAALRNGHIGAAARRIRAARVRIRLLQVTCNGVDYALWNLSSAGTVQKCRGVPINGLRERRKLGTNPGEVEAFSNCGLSAQHEYLSLRRRGSHLINFLPEI